MSIMNHIDVRLITQSNCTGCGLCSEKCPQNCISMAPNEEGFLFPTVDLHTCINCGVCSSYCPINTDGNDLKNSGKRKYFCAIISDNDKLIKSSSGGVFRIVADWFVDNNALVCGCVYNDQMVATHIISNRIEDISRMCGSKYVQSKISHTFSAIKNNLLSGNKIMVTGTACQLAALKMYLGDEYDNLFCVEILCHGVPSPSLFDKYVLYLERKLRGKIVDIQFRNKEKNGWGSEHRTCIVYEKNNKLLKYRPTLPAYFSAFFYGINLRESCYNCKFATPERVADLTIGDFWGSWSKYGKRFKQGISVIGVNTKKGEELVNNVKHNFDFFESLTEDEAFKSNDNFEHPVKRPDERKDFYKNLPTYNGLWKRTYMTKTYRRKTIASIYGAFVPAGLRFFIQGLKNNG